MSESVMSINVPPLDTLHGRKVFIGAGLIREACIAPGYFDAGVPRSFCKHSSRMPAFKSSLAKVCRRQWMV